MRLWHGDADLQGVDAVVIPGGFSYGDYLRVGAIARFSPVMESVVEFSRAGGLVLGICNGFQVLCEAGLLPGALLPNVELRRVLDVQLDEAAYMHAGHALEAERGQRALDRLALRIQDPRLRPDQDPRPHAEVRSSQAENGSPESFSYAVT